jgi:polynucleotide 5'-kinase involved in rRNA processing
LETYRKISLSLSKNNIKFIKEDYDPEAKIKIQKEIDVHELIKLPYHYVIIALLSEDSHLIKLGLLFVVNIEKDYVLIFSDLSYKEQTKVKKILLGSLRLSTKGNHQGYLYL